MPSTLFPLPISLTQLKRHFFGLGDVLEALSVYTGQTVDEVAGDHIRSAQWELEQSSSFPYFVTRYCTEEVAARPDGSSGGTPLVLGEDYDRILQPMDYIIDDWMNGSASVKLPWRPIYSIALYRFTFTGGAQIVDLPLGWANPNCMTGRLSIMPQGLGITSTQYYRLLLLFPFYRGSPCGTVIPNLIHMRYSAGLVDANLGDSDEYDDAAAEAPQKNTKWEQGIVSRFQRAIGLLASATLMRELASEIDKGGASISFAGLSESVNPQVLTQRADNNEKKATEWSDTIRGQYLGPLMVMV